MCHTFIADKIDIWSVIMIKILFPTDILQKLMNPEFQCVELNDSLQQFRPACGGHVGILKLGCRPTIWPQHTFRLSEYRRNKTLWSWNTLHYCTALNVDIITYFQHGVEEVKLSIDSMNQENIFWCHMQTTTNFGFRKNIYLIRTNVLMRALRDINMSANFESSAYVSAVPVESIILKFST